jgi:predicted MFS family arabinose efflux permease
VIGTNRLSRGLVVVLATSAGLSVANNYYAQPLLPAISRSLHVSSATAGLIVTCSQIGYAVGLLLLVPLGDRVDRRRLVVVIGVASAFALAGVGSAPSVVFILPAAFALGALVQSPTIVPFAATLADDHERGRVVGMVMSGLLLGILLARTVAGYVAEAGSWRLVYFIAAAMMLIQAIVLASTLPRSRQTTALTYGQLLRSLGRLVADEPVLRVRCAYGALSMGAFSVLWTSIAFLLAGSHYRYGSGTIGLFGLAGAAGVGAATLAGRFADRNWSRFTTGTAAVLLLVSWLPMWLGAHSIAYLLIGIVTFDIGVQGIHITNQSQIFRLQPAARSRINSVYMMTYFLGGAVGSLCSAVAYHAGGWGSVCLVGTAFSAGTLLVWLAVRGRPLESHVSAPHGPIGERSRG